MIECKTVDSIECRVVGVVGVIVCSVEAVEAADECRIVAAGAGVVERKAAMVAGDGEPVERALRCIGSRSALGSANYSDSGKVEGVGGTW